MHASAPVLGGVLAVGSLKRQAGSAMFEESYWTMRALSTPGRSISRAVSDASLEGLVLPSAPEEVATDELLEIDAGATGTVTSSAVTLILTSVGSSVFALPFAFSLAGAGCGASLATVLGLLSLLAAYGLSRCCEAVGLYSYEEIVVAAWGARGAFVMELLIVVLLLGAMAALVTLIGDALPAVAELLFPMFAFSDFPDLCPARGTVIIFVLAFVLAPISCVKSMASLRHSNTVGVVCVFIVCVFVTINGAADLTKGGGLLAHRPAFTDASGAVQAVPILMLSYCMHIQVPPVYGEFANRSVHHFSRALVLQYVVCTAIYISVGVFGLRLFKPEEAVPGDVLLGFGPERRAVLAMRAMVGLSGVFVFPLLSLPCRSTVDHLLFGGGAAAAPQAQLRHVSEALLLVAIAGLVAMEASSLGKVAAITGATGGAVLCYVLPCLLFLRLCSSCGGSSALELWAFRVALLATAALSALALHSVVVGLLAT